MPTIRSLTLALAGATLALPSMAQAALAVGAKAPDFTTRGALAGKVFTLKLSDALKKGPVVLYFFPKQGTPGCTVEAHAFAEANDDFKKAGATVIGMSADSVEDLKGFSVEACRNKFALGSAGPGVISGYDVALATRPGMTNRTSYVIAPNGTIAYVYSDMKPEAHISNTLAKVREMKGK